MFERTKKDSDSRQHTILFVCYGNVHRSVLAEEITNTILKQNLLDTKYKAKSRGIQGSLGFEKPKLMNLKEYENEWKLTQKALKLHVDTEFFSDRQSTPVDTQSIQQATLIVAMDKKVYNILQKHFPDQVNQMFLFSLWLDTPDTDDLMDSEDEEKHTMVNKNIVQGIRNNLISKL